MIFQRDLAGSSGRVCRNLSNPADQQFHRAVKPRLLGGAEGLFVGAALPPRDRKLADLAEEVVTDPQRP